jgi:hypothetical protein
MKRFSTWPVAYLWFFVMAVPAMLAVVVLYHLRDRLGRCGLTAGNATWAPHTWHYHYFGPFSWWCAHDPDGKNKITL